MLEDYLSKLSQSRQAHPISEGDYEAFKCNPVFKRLLNDMEVAMLSGMEEIGAHQTIEMNGARAIKFREARESLEFVQDWKPEELSIDEE